MWCDVHYGMGLFSEPGGVQWGVLGALDPTQKLEGSGLGSGLRGSRSSQQEHPPGASCSESCPAGRNLLSPQSWK